MKHLFIDQNQLNTEKLKGKSKRKNYVTQMSF